MHNRQYTKFGQEIERCTRLYEGFADAAPFVKAVYECVDRFRQDHPITPQPAVDPQEAADMLRAGRSLEVNPALDTEAAVELLIRIGEALVEANPELETTMRVVEEKLEQFLLNSPDKVSKEDMWGLCQVLVRETELEQDLATFLFSTTLSYFYREHLQGTADVLRTDLWQGGNCPLCAEKPHYGLLRPKDGAKELECWLCETTWVHSRIKCPFCGNEEQEDLGYFTVEDQEICRVSFCQRCRQYLKIIDGRKFDASGGIILSIHNLASLSHDLLARQEGFAPGSGLEWVNQQEITDRREVVEKW
ncbi:MAG: formate dehydrogenase accessory protein FdhE [Dehalococcoidia bacterium]